MQIQTTDEIEGVPLLKIRALFRQAGLDGVVSADLVGRQPNLTKSKTDRVISALRRLGFLEAIRARRGVRRAEKRVATVQERNSPPRGTPRNRSAAKPLRRETAEHLLSQLLERITALKSDPRFLARVQKARVFGSYVGDADRIGDLDVALQLVRREPDFDKHTEAQ